MITIYKYKLEILDRQIIQMPVNAEILSVKNKGNDLFICGLVNTDNSFTNYEIEIFGTGTHVYKTSNTFREFIGTCIMPNGLVLHIFNRIS